MEPVVRPVFTVAEIDGKIIVSAEIAECDDFDKPCYYRGVGKIKGSYVRVGDADIPWNQDGVLCHGALCEAAFARRKAPYDDSRKTKKQVAAVYTMQKILAASVSSGEFFGWKGL